MPIRYMLVTKEYIPRDNSQPPSIQNRAEECKCVGYIKIEDAFMAIYSLKMIDDLTLYGVHEFSLNVTYPLEGEDFDEAGNFMKRHYVIPHPFGYSKENEKENNEVRNANPIKFNINPPKQ
jgi:hypothetical protein